MVPPEVTPSANDTGRMVFLADVHLEAGGGPRTRSFIRFLSEFCNAGDKLYVLGDLFDLWLGRGHERRQGYTEVLAAITKAVSRGIELNMLPGNRDFLMSVEIETACGACVLPEEFELTIDDRRWLLCHGDRFCTADRGYQRLRWFLHSRLLRFIVGCLPLSVRRLIAGPIRKRSQADIAKKTDNRMGLVDDELLRRINGGIDTIICGHVHSKQERDIGAGRLFVLGSWEDTAEVLVYRRGEWEWRNV